MTLGLLSVRSLTEVVRSFKSEEVGYNDVYLIIVWIILQYFDLVESKFFVLLPSDVVNYPENN
jgi:hypothetical protein